MKSHYSQTSNKLCHYNAQGNSQDIVYIIVLIIITVNNTQIRVQNKYLKFDLFVLHSLYDFFDNNELEGIYETLSLSHINILILSSSKPRHISKFEEIFIKKNYIRNKKLRQIVRRSINIKLKKL